MDHDLTPGAPPPPAPSLARRAFVPRVLRDEPQYRLLFSSQVLSVLGDRVMTIALPFAVLAVGGGVTQVAIVSAAQFLPFVLLALPAGVWADRLDRKRLLIASDVVRLLCEVVAAVLLLSGTASVWQLAALAAVFGSADAFFAPAFTGLLPTTVAPHHVQDANALRGLTASVAGILGPALAGVLVAVGGPGTAFLFDAATFAVSAVLLAPLRSVRSAPETEDDEQPRFLDSLREGRDTVRSRPWVVGFLGGFAVYHAVTLPAIFVLGPVLMDERYGGAGSWAIISAMFAAGSVLGDLLLLRWRPARPLRAASFLLVGASCQAAVVGSHLPVLGIGALELLTGVCVTGMFTLWETTLGEQIDPGSLSRVSSYDYLCTVGIIPLGNLVAGLAAAAVGVEHCLWGLGVVSIVSSLVLCRVPAVRDLRRPVAAV